MSISIHEAFLGCPLGARGGAVVATDIICRIIGGGGGQRLGVLPANGARTLASLVVNGCAGEPE